MGSMLYHHDQDADEGILSQRKSRLVSRVTLARALDNTELGSVCRVGGQVKPPWPDSVKANLCEALIGAVFLDGGWPAAAHAVERLLSTYLDAEPAASPADVKNRLQASALASTGSSPAIPPNGSAGAIMPLSLPAPSVSATNPPSAKAPAAAELRSLLPRNCSLPLSHQAAPRLRHRRRCRG